MSMLVGARNTDPNASSKAGRQWPAHLLQIAGLCVQLMVASCPGETLPTPIILKVEHGDISRSYCHSAIVESKI